MMKGGGGRIEVSRDGAFLVRSPPALSHRFRGGSFGFVELPAIIIPLILPLGGDKKTPNRT